MGSINGNCIIPDGIKTLLIINTSRNKTKDYIYISKNHDHDYFKIVELINAYTRDVTMYIAGFIAMKLDTKKKCLY